MKYVKKPIEVEAFQFGVDEYPEWFKPGCTNGYPDRDNFYCSFICHIKDDVHIAHKGDMIIKGIQGEIYPCKKDIFDATYDLAECEKPFKYPVIGSEND
jgi:hypothetical protein